MKTKRSIYVIIDKEDGAYKADDRKALRETINMLGVDKIDSVYRAVPLAITTETTVKIGAVKPEPEVAKNGAKNDKKNSH